MKKDKFEDDIMDEFYDLTNEFDIIFSRRIRENPLILTHFFGHILNIFVVIGLLSEEGSKNIKKLLAAELKKGIDSQFKKN